MVSGFLSGYLRAGELAIIFGWAHQENKDPSLRIGKMFFFIKNRMLLKDTSSTAQGGGGSFKNRKPIGELGCCELGMAERSH